MWNATSWSVNLCQQSNMGCHLGHYITPTRLFKFPQTILKRVKWSGQRHKCTSHTASKIILVSVPNMKRLWDSGCPTDKMQKWHINKQLSILEILTDIKYAFKQPQYASAQTCGHQGTVHCQLPTMKDSNINLMIYQSELQALATSTTRKISHKSHRLFYKYKV